jgi:hypothetical protein
MDILRDDNVNLLRDTTPEIPQMGDFGADVTAPSRLDVLPDGREVVVIGDPQGDKAFTHKQGEHNLLGYEGTCGLCSCENVLRSFGLDVTESDITVFAAERGLCDTGNPDPRQNGGTTAEWQAEILTRHGIPASASRGGSLEDLAANIEQGRGVIAEVDAGVIWDEPSFSNWLGQPNHAIAVTGVARDPMTGDIRGFFINDSGTGKAAQFVDASVMNEAWVQAGGEQVVTAEDRPYVS